MKFGKEYFDFCKDDNGCDFDCKGGWQENYANFIKSNFPEFIGKKTLDFGCAKGANTSALLDVGYDMFGIDVSQWYVENCVFENVKDRLFSYDAEEADFPFVDEQFDFIHSQQVIEHMHKKDILNTLKELNRVLKMDGLIYIATVGEDKNGLDSEPTHYSCLSEKEWIKYFKKAGFKLITNEYPERAEKLLNGKMPIEYSWVQFVFKKVK